MVKRLRAVPLLLIATLIVWSGGQRGHEAMAAPLKLQQGLAKPYVAPEFSGTEQWINSEPLMLQQLRGKVVLIDFWTYSCINCIRTFPYITQWDKKYRDQGLVIIGVHAPEFEFEKDIKNITAAIERYGIRYPVLIDNDKAIWKSYKNRYWPAHYLIDKRGRVVYTHFGEGKYEVTENNIRTLLGLKQVSDARYDKVPYSAQQTPETYLGYKRTKHFSSPEPMVRNAQATYTPPTALAVHQWALEGPWIVHGEKITAGAPASALKLHFRARKVYLVLGSADGKPVTARITLNGKPISDIEVDAHRLYDVVDQQVVQEGELKITADAPGLEAYAFTFGS